MSELEEQLQLDREKIKTSVSLQLPIEITSYTLPRNTEAYIRSVMETFIDECHQEQRTSYQRKKSQHKARLFQRKKSRH